MMQRLAFGLGVVMLLCAAAQWPSADAQANKCCFECIEDWTQFPECVGDCTNDWGRGCSGAIATPVVHPGTCVPWPLWTCIPPSSQNQCNFLVYSETCTSTQAGCPPGEWRCAWQAFGGGVNVTVNNCSGNGPTPQDPDDCPYEVPNPWE